MPVDIAALAAAFARRHYLLTEHASDQAAQRAVASDEIEEAVTGGEVIEDYPHDKYRPSCLIMGRTAAGRVLHVQVTYPPAVKVVTVYEPSPDRWSADFRVRKSHE
jgi:hypothetical protein